MMLSCSTNHPTAKFLRRGKRNGKIAAVIHSGYSFELYLPRACGFLSLFHSPPASTRFLSPLEFLAATYAVATEICVISVVGRHRRRRRWSRFNPTCFFFLIPRVSLATKRFHVAVAWIPIKIIAPFSNIRRSSPSVYRVDFHSRSQRADYALCACTYLCRALAAATTM